MPERIHPIAWKKAAASLLTRKLFYGAAISCAVGLGLGVWLKPPKVHYGSAVTPAAVAEAQQAADAGDVADAAPAPTPVSQTSSDPDAQQAAVSPPAGPQPVQLAQADPAQADASGDTSRAQPDDAVPAEAAYERPGPDRAHDGSRAWSDGYDARGRDNEDYLDAGPPPSGWDGPPPRSWGPPGAPPGPGPGWSGPPGDDGGDAGG